MPALSTPVPCACCKKPYVRTGYRSRYCPAWAAAACSSCKRVGAHHPDCSRAGGKANAKPKKATGGGTRSKPKPAGKPAVHGNDLGPIAARIRVLREAIEAGDRARTEFDAIRKEMA